MDLKSIIAALSALFAVAPVINEELGHEQAKADTASMVTYASLVGDGVLVDEAPKARCLVFYFDGCPPCARLHQTIDRELVPNGFTVGKNASDDFEYIDVYGRDDRVKTYKRGARWACPTMVIVDSKGKELARHVGALQAKQLTEWLAKYRK